MSGLLRITRQRCYVGQCTQSSLQGSLQHEERPLKTRSHDAQAEFGNGQNLATIACYFNQMHWKDMTIKMSEEHGQVIHHRRHRKQARLLRAQVEEEHKAQNLATIAFYRYQPHWQNITIDNK